MSAVTLCDQVACDPRRAVPNRPQIIQPLDVQIARAVTAGPGGMSRAAGLTAAVPPALAEGEDDALVDAAAFQLAVGLGGLLHRHGCVRAPPDPPPRPPPAGPWRTGGAPRARGSVSRAPPTSRPPPPPRAAARWVRMTPPPPPPPNSRTPSPPVTFSCRSTRPAPSAELGSAAASSH